MWGGRGVSAGHPCSTHVLPRLLRYAAKRAVRIMPWGGSMLDETGFYAPSMAHNALPGRPWPGISVFLGHNSTVSKQLRYSRACYATLLRELYELCLGVVLCLTKPAFMRLPWRITPCPAVHGRAFLFFLGIILQSLSSFAIRLRGSACALPDARRLRHLRCDSILRF